MHHLIKRYELILAGLFSAFLLLMPYGLFFGPLFYVLVLIAIYLRNTQEQLRKMRVEWLGYQNQMLNYAKEGTASTLETRQPPQSTLANTKGAVE